MDFLKSQVPICIEKGIQMTGKAETTYTHATGSKCMYPRFKEPRTGKLG